MAQDPAGEGCVPDPQPASTREPGRQVCVCVRAGGGMGSRPELLRRESVSLLKRAKGSLLVLFNLLKLGGAQLSSGKLAVFQRKVRSPRRGEGLAVWGAPAKNSPRAP